MESQDLVKTEALELTQRISTLRQSKEDAIASGDFELATRLRDSEVDCQSKLTNFSFPFHVLVNLKRRADGHRPSRSPVLDMLETEPGVADPRILQQWPASVQSPISLAFEHIPESPSGTLGTALKVHDVFSIYFQAKLPVLCPETIRKFKPQVLDEALRAMFNEIRRCTQQVAPAVLSLVAPTFLDAALQSTVVRGIKETRCDVVVFQNSPANHDLAEALLPEITLYFS